MFQYEWREANEIRLDGLWRHHAEKPGNWNFQLKTFWQRNHNSLLETRIHVSAEDDTHLELLKEITFIDWIHFLSAEFRPNAQKHPSDYRGLRLQCSLCRRSVNWFISMLLPPHTTTTRGPQTAGSRPKRRRCDKNWSSVIEIPPNEQRGWRVYLHPVVCV